jgi:hypothetical protein
MRVTVRDLAETIAGLRRLADDLRGSADGGPFEGIEEGFVVARRSGLKSGAEFLDRVIDELLDLMPETPVQALEDDDHG